MGYGEPDPERGVRLDSLRQHHRRGPGQIPAGSTIQTATLTLEVTNASVAPNGSVNESTVDWAEATATWNNFGGDAGVQADEYLASPQYAAPIAAGSQGDHGDDVGPGVGERPQKQLRLGLPAGQATTALRWTRRSSRPWRCDRRSR